MIVGRRYNDSDPAVERAMEAHEDERYETEENDVSTPETITDLADVKAGDVVTARFVETGETITATAHHPDDTPAGWVSLLGWPLSKGNGKFGLGIKKFELVSATRPAPPSPAPGTAGTATVRGQQGVTVMRVEVGQPYQEPGIETLWRSAQGVPGGSSVFYNHEDDQITDFVPDADTAALRAEVERAAVAAENLIRAQKIEEEARLWEQARADAADARVDAVLAFLDAPGKNVSCAGLDLSTPGCFAHDLAARILALVAADEQAAEGEITCTCTVNVGGCLAGCTDERVIDSACPVHGVSVPGVGGAA